MNRVLKKAVGRVLAILPERVIVALLPRRYRFTRAEATPLPPVAPVARRLYVAPVNWAGQGWQWARAAERHLPDVAAVTMSYRLGGEFGYPVDQSVPVGAYVTSRRWQRAQREGVMRDFSHVIIEAERQPLGRILDESVIEQARDLIDAGLRVAMLCHGTDIRLPSRHAAANEDSHFAPGMWSQTPALERQASTNRAVLDELALPVFVSTPDLLIDVPYATWLPVIVDPEVWSAPRPLQRSVPVVAHAPSKGIVKGSDLIDPIMRKLDAEGVISYLRVQGVPAAEMPAVVASADIVLDQFRIGNYGVSSCEAMASGRLVVSHVTAQVRDHVRGATGMELPILEATAATLEEVVRSIAADPASFAGFAATGPDFVRAIHDGTRSASVLAEFLADGSR